ncbi:IS1 family transposase [Xenorhabdus japonica]
MNLTLCPRLKRFNRKMIYSKSEAIHYKMIGIFIEREYYSL